MGYSCYYSLEKILSFRLLISLSKFNLPLIGTFTWPTPPGPYRGTTVGGGGGIKLWITYILFWPHKDMEGLRGWVISPMPGPPKRQQTWKTIHTKHTLSHPNKANMKGWFWRPNDIRGRCGPKASWHLSYRWRKSRKKLLGKLVPTGDGTRPAAWETKALLLDHSYNIYVPSI